MSKNVRLEIDLLICQCPGYSSSKLTILSNNLIHFIQAETNPEISDALIMWIIKGQTKLRQASNQCVGSDCGWHVMFHKVYIGNLGVYFKKNTYIHILILSKTYFSGHTTQIKNLVKKELTETRGALTNQQIL